MKINSKAYDTIREINQADEEYYQIWKDRFKARTGKKIARGFLDSPEYKKGFLKGANQRRRRFKARALEKIKDNTATLEYVDQTEPLPFWHDVWYKPGGKARSLITDNMRVGGEFAAFIKLVDYDLNGNEFIVEQVEIKNPYIFNTTLKRLYRELEREKLSAPKSNPNYFFTTSTLYELDDLLILDMKVELGGNRNISI